MTGKDLLEELLRLPVDYLQQDVAFITEEQDFNCPECGAKTETTISAETHVLTSVSPCEKSPNLDGNFILLS